MPNADATELRAVFLWHIFLGCFWCMKKLDRNRNYETGQLCYISCQH